MAEVTPVVTEGRLVHCYKVIKPIGKGSFGQVFLIKHRQEEKQVRFIRHAAGTRRVSERPIPEASRT
jgi:serine/threonine protein kinase